MSSVPPGSDVAAPDKPADFQWLKSYPDGVRWDQEFEARPLFDLLDEAAASFPRNTCTDFLGRQRTYGQIGEAVNRAAAALQAIGVTKGTKVGLFLPNCPTFIVYYYATLKAGGTVVNFNPLYTLEELAYQIRDSETRFMVTLDLEILFGKVEALLADRTLEHAIVASFPALLPPAKAALFKLFKSKELARPLNSTAAEHLTLEAALPKNAPLTPVDIDPHADIAVLQYTGGTTGSPKGAMLSHANVAINAQQVAAWAPGLENGKETILGVLPFFHVFAMTVVMNLAIAKAARIVIMPRFVLDDTLRLIHTARPSLMPGVPTLFNAILNHPKLSNYDLSSLSFCISGGAPLPVEVKHRFEALTGCSLVEGYGLSEAAPVVTCNAIKGLNKPGSIGMPLPATEISLRDLDDPRRDVEPGTPGEICIKGPQVMLGYWRRQQETADIFVDGYLRTGDVARMDEDGMFFIEDRIKDLIISSGYNVYPRQIEEAIYTHDAVEEATVIGIPDDYRGEIPKAFVKLRDGATISPDDLRNHLATKLSKLEIPAEIEFRDQLPKTMIGKLSKKELKAEEMARRAGRTSS